GGADLGDHIALCTFQCHGAKAPCSSAYCKVPWCTAYGATYVRQRLKIQEHFRRGNASLTLFVAAHPLQTCRFP
ncbi:hypothetical protein RFM41_33345, partial [Mesorhizobium sp. VK25A]